MSVVILQLVWKQMRSWPSSWELEWKERRTGWHLKAALSIPGSRTNKLKDGRVGRAGVVRGIGKEKRR